STDGGKTWQPDPAISLPGYDLRDPKLTPWGGKLLLTFTAWDVSNTSLDRTIVRAAVSQDGRSFSLVDPPALPQSVGLAAGRPRGTGDALLLPVWTADELLGHADTDRVSLLRSTDGAAFSLASALPLGGGVAQAELLVQSGGRLLLVAPEQQ